MPPYRTPGLLAPPPPPGIAPVEIPLRIPAELIPIPDFLGDEQKEPLYVEPVLEVVPPFEAPVPQPKPPLILPKKRKDPLPPSIRPYPPHPIPMPPLILEPPLQSPDPVFVPPNLERIPVFHNPPMHTLPAFPDAVQWDIFVHRRLAHGQSFASIFRVPCVIETTSVRAGREGVGGANARGCRSYGRGCWWC